jgi:hypothetical protein
LSRRGEEIIPLIDASAGWSFEIVRAFFEKRIGENVQFVAARLGLDEASNENG